MKRWHKVAQFGMVLGVVLSSVHAARGACLAQPGKVVWSYPSHGAVDVPVNPTVWLYLRNHNQQLGQPELDGTPLAPASAPFSYAPGQLAPNTSHVIRIPVTSDEDAGVSELRIEFETGSRTVSVPAPSVVVGELSVVGDTSNDPSDAIFEGTLAECETLFFVHDCFDTGNVTVYGPPPTATRPLAWLVEWAAGDPPSARIHPDECGPPLVVQYNGPQCTPMRAIFDGGIATEAIQVCPGEPDSGGPVPDSGHSEPDSAVELDAGRFRPDRASSTPEASPRDQRVRGDAMPMQAKAVSPGPASGCSLPPRTGARSGGAWLLLSIVCAGWRRLRATAIHLDPGPADAG